MPAVRSAGWRAVLSAMVIGSAAAQLAVGAAPLGFAGGEDPPQVRIEHLHYRPRADGTGAIAKGAEGRLEAPFTGSVLLPAGSWGIEIAYAAAGQATPENMRFQVRLDASQEKGWLDVGRQREVFFSALPPGDYVFRVRAASEGGAWSETPASVAFSIQAHYWQTLWFRFGAAGLLIAMGVGVAWSFSRVTRRRQRQADERFRLATEAAPSGMIMVDASGRIVLVNAQAEVYFGYSRQELIGRQIEMLIPKRFTGGHAGLRHGYVADPAARRMGIGRELSGLRKDGTEFPIEIGLNPIQTSVGKLVLASVLDISERHHAELEIARQRNEVAHLSRVTMLSELSGSLAHELNQPLTAILSNAQAAQRFLARTPIDMNELREILTDIVEEGKRAGDVIHRLRLLLKKGEVQQVALDVGEVVRDVLKLVRSDLINHGVTVHADLDAALPRALGDRVQIQQVLVNLVINGCDAMAGVPSGGRRLTVSARSDGEKHVRVSVSDAGAGIAPEHLGQIFQPFFTTKPTGMGLGLAVCRTIITANGGDLWAANNTERGATFHFTVPVVKETAE
jgi:PAS domain S-box-containing protein